LPPAKEIEVIALPAIPPSVNVSQKARPRRRSVSLRERGRLAAGSMKLELGLFRRLFAYTRPYRGRLFLSWSGR
jgi:hypothetical protein